MSYLEHLIENGLVTLEEHPDKWEEWMKEDENLPHTNLTLDDLWEICQYIIYVWMPCSLEGGM